MLRGLLAVLVLGVLVGFDVLGQMVAAHEALAALRTLEPLLSCQQNNTLSKGQSMDPCWITNDQGSMLNS